MRNSRKLTFFLTLLILTSAISIFQFIPSVKATTPVFMNGYVTSGTGTSISLTLNFTPTAGNVLTFGVTFTASNSTARALSSITQTNVNWQSSAGASIWQSSNYGGAQVWAGNVSSSPSTSISAPISGGTATWSACVMEFANLIAVYDKSATNSGTTGTSISTGNTTTISIAPEIAVSASCSAYFSGAPLQGYTNKNPNVERSGHLYKILSTVAPTGTGGTGHASSWWAIVVVTLKTPLVGAKFDNPSISSNENGVNSLMSMTATNYSSPLSGFIFSWDISGSYVNDSWIVFPDITNTWANTTKMVFGTLGQIVHWVLFGNDSLNQWSISDIQSFTIQATVIFYFNTGGGLWRNNAAIPNGTVTTYTSPTSFSLTAICNSTYSYQSFNFTNQVDSSILNPISYTVTNQSTITLNFGSGSFSFAGDATEDKVFQGYTFYSDTSTLLTGTYTTPTPSPTSTPTPTPTATPTPAPTGTPNPSDYIPVAESQNQTVTYALVVGMISAILVFCLALMAASRSKGGRK